MADSNDLPPAHPTNFRKGLGCLAILAGLLLVAGIIGWINDTPANRAERAAREAKRNQEQAASEAKRAQEQATLRKLRAERETRQQEEKGVEREKVDAIAHAQIFVERRLKSPSSAKFPWPSKFRVVRTGPHEYIVHSYVDAQNSFGAMIRSNFVCRMRVSGEKWTLVDVVIQ